MSFERNKIYLGNVMDIIKSWSSNCIDTIITSPPYWSLRDYQNQPIIWDITKPDCEHEWIEVKAGLQHENRNGLRGTQEEIHQQKKETWIRKFDETKSYFCSKCNCWKGSLGLEPDFNLYIKHLCDIFQECSRILKDSGSCWVNIGDTYWGGGQAQGHTKDTKNCGKTTLDHGYIQKPIAKGKQYKAKSLVLIPFRFAIEMVNRGWILRNVIIWYKPNCMPSSASDRFTIDFEYLFFFTKKPKYYFQQQLEPLKYPDVKGDHCIGGKNKHEGYGNQTYSGNEYDATKLDGRNKRCVWEIPTSKFSGAHFAVFPEKLIQTPILASCPRYVLSKCEKPFTSIIKQILPKIVPGIVLDPFLGSGTTAVICKKLNRDYAGIEINPGYVEIAEKRISETQPGSLVEESEIEFKEVKNLSEINSFTIDNFISLSNNKREKVEK